MVNIGGLFDKAKRLATENTEKVKKYAAENSDSVRGGLDKVEHAINDRTKGRYADKLAKGRGGLTKALGVDDTPGPASPTAGTSSAPGNQATSPQDDVRAGAPQSRPGDVGVDPVDPAAPVDPPSPLDTPDGSGPRRDPQPQVDILGEIGEEQGGQASTEAPEHRRDGGPY